MSVVRVSCGSAWNSSHVHRAIGKPVPRTVKSHLASGVRGVGPAESTGKSRVSYWPGGSRPAVADGCRRPRNPRETKGSVMLCQAPETLDGPLTGSEPRQALRAVVGNRHAGDLLERTVRMSGVAHQFCGIPVNLVEMGAVWRDPVVGRAAAHGSVEPPSGAVSGNLRARGIGRDFQTATVDVVAADIAVAEVRRVYSSVVRGNRQPAQLGGHACARVNLHDRADADLAVFLDGAHGRSEEHTSELQSLRHLVC